MSCQVEVEHNVLYKTYVSCVLQGVQDVPIPQGQGKRYKTSKYM